MGETKIPNKRSVQNSKASSKIGTRILQLTSGIVLVFALTACHATKIYVKTRSPDSGDLKIAPGSKIALLTCIVGRHGVRNNADGRVAVYYDMKNAELNGMYKSFARPFEENLGALMISPQRFSSSKTFKSISARSDKEILNVSDGLLFDEATDEQSLAAIAKELGADYIVLTQMEYWRSGWWLGKGLSIFGPITGRIYDKNGKLRFSDSENTYVSLKEEDYPAKDNVEKMWTLAQRIPRQYWMAQTKAFK